MSDLGWDAGGPFLAMKVAIPGEDVVFNTKLVICDALESAYPGCHTFFYNNDILAVATGCAASAQKQRFFQIAAGVAQDFHISIGVSQLFDELSALRSYCEQSDVALRLGMELEPLKSIHCFDSHTLTYILRQCTTRFSANMLAPPSLSRLMAYDRKYNTEFAKTLRVYMECDCSTAQAAARLFIHRSTLLYRLDRIKELFGLDLSDNDEKLHMLLAFKLLDGQQASG